MNLKKNSVMILIVLILMIILSIITVPNGLLDVTDTKDYSDTAKFFAGEYSAKHRASHSIVYGLMISPYVKLTSSFFLLKFINVLWMFLIILSVYYLSNKNKKTLLLILTLPLIWYMVPWLSPLPLVSLLFVWTYHFLKLYDKEEKINNLVYSGILIGLAGAIWDTAVYFSIIFMISFLFNKKLTSSFLFLISVFIGLLPGLILDQVFFGFPFYSIAKHASAVLAFALYNGIYSQGFPTDIFSKVLVLIFVPFYVYLTLKKENLKNYKKEAIFFIVSILFILTNSQIRLLITIAPIIILTIGNILNKKQFKIQLIIFLILSLLVISPYIIQSKYDTNAKNFKLAITSFPNIELNKSRESDTIKKDLIKISEKYPNEIFLVGNKNDDYRELAHIYWGDKIEEFVSLEDYKLFLEGESEITKKRISSDAFPEFRREIWFEIGLGKNSNDQTDYSSINYAISFEDNFIIDNFIFVEKFDKLSVFIKS